MVAVSGLASPTLTFMRPADDMRVTAAALTLTGPATRPGVATSKLTARLPDRSSPTMSGPTCVAITISRSCWARAVPTVAPPVAPAVAVAGAAAGSSERQSVTK